jgi:hypothetical protein
MLPVFIGIAYRETSDLQLLDVAIVTWFFTDKGAYL